MLSGRLWELFWLQTPRETKNLKIGAHHLNAVCSHNLLTEVADPGIELNEAMYPRPPPLNVVQGVGEYT